MPKITIQQALTNISQLIDMSVKMGVFNQAEAVVIMQSSFELLREHVKDTQAALDQADNIIDGLRKEIAYKNNIP